MKRNKKLVGLGAALLLSCGVLAGAHSLAAEKKVYIPSETLRSDILSEVAMDPETEEIETIENDVPTAKQMERLTRSISFNSHSEYDKSASLEGLQYAKNVTEFFSSANNLIDYRPLGEMTNLEHIQLYFDSYGVPEVETMPINLDFIRNLKKLKRFDGGLFTTLDLSPFNDLDNIEMINAQGHLYSTVPITVSKKNRSGVLGNPMTYSKHFADGQLSVDVSQVTPSKHYLGYDYLKSLDVAIEGDNFFVKEIPEGTEYINFEIIKEGKKNSGFMYSMQYTCPVNWY